MNVGEPFFTYLLTGRKRETVKNISFYAYESPVSGAKITLSETPIFVFSCINKPYLRQKDSTGGFRKLVQVWGDSRVRKSYSGSLN